MWWRSHDALRMKRWLDAGNGVRVTGEGLAWLPEARTIVVADVHLGYDLAARRRGGFLPEAMSGAAAGERLIGLARAYDATRLVVAGDLRHSTRDVDDVERAEVVAFANVIRRELLLDVVLGNHDAGDSLAGDGHALVSIDNVDVVHVPPRARPARMTICGHLHPRITLRDETGTSARYPCVLASSATVILPAFSEWAGGTEAARLIRDLPVDEWRALPVHDGFIADVGIRFAPREA